MWPRTLKRLKISFDEENHGNLVRKLIGQLSNLICLKICVDHDRGPSPDGSIWEELIRSSLLLLVKFQFYFIFNLSPYINTTIDSFSTPFYLRERCWFIRCDTNTRTGSACLYSLPFLFDRFAIHTYSFNNSRTTLLTDSHSNKTTYRNIKTLTFNYACPKPHVAFRSTRIEELILNVAFVPNIWLPILTQIHHLSIGSHVRMTSSSLVHLLENSTKLYHLTIEIVNLETLTGGWNDLAVCHLLSNKIRRLDLDPKKNSSSMSRTNIKPDELTYVVRIFGSNCEHLTIYLETYEILESFILPSMKKLRSLTVSGVFNRCGRTFVMNSIEQWSLSNKHSAIAIWNGLQIWFDSP